MEEIVENLVNSLPILIGIVIVIILILISHIKAPPNTAVVISGLRKEPRVLIGRTRMRIPLLERIDRLMLKQMVMEVHTGRAIATLDYMDIQVSVVMKVKIGEDLEALKKAAKHFLNQYPEDTMNELQMPLQAVLREVIATNTLENVVKEKEVLANQIHQRAQVSLNELGIEVISCIIKAVEDEAGLLKALGMEKSTEIHKQATLLKAEADREIAVETSKAKKEANDAHVLAKAEIAQKNQELEIKQAQLQKEIDIKNMEIELELAEAANELKLKQAELMKVEEWKRAESEIAFEEATLEKRRAFELAQSQADFEREERALKVKEKAAQVTEQDLEAEI